MSNLLHIQGETYCHCEYSVLFYNMENAQVCVCVGIIWAYSHNKHEHVHHQPIAQRTLGQQLFLNPKWCSEFYTAVSSSCDDPHGFLNLCGARKGECSLGMAPILLCKMGLVLNGVHQFLPCRGSMGSLVLLLLPLIHLLRSLSAAANQAFTEHKRSFPLAKGMIIWSVIAVHFHSWSSSSSQEKSWW